jgi:hypothetical protein
MVLPLAVAAPLAIGVGTGIGTYFGGRRDKRGEPQKSGLNAAEYGLQQGSKRDTAVINALMRAANDPRLAPILKEYNITPQDILYNPQASEVQEGTPEIPRWQQGLIAEPHRLEKGVYEELENPDIEGVLSKYMAPFNAVGKRREQLANENYDKLIGKANARQGITNNRINPGSNSSFQNQLNNLEERRNHEIENIRDDMAMRNTEAGINFMNQRQGAKLGAGEAIRGYHQQQLEAMNGRGQLVNDPRFQQARGFQEYMQPLLGGSIGPTEGRASGLTRLAGLGTQLLNTSFKYGNRGMNPEPYGAQRVNPYNGMPYNASDNIEGTPWRY